MPFDWVSILQRFSRFQLYKFDHGYMLTCTTPMPPTPQNQHEATYQVVAPSDDLGDHIESLVRLRERLTSSEETRSCMAFFNIGRFSAALVVCWELIERLTLRREFGCLALVQLIAADCLAELHESDSLLQILIQALVNANRHGGEDLIAHVELRHIAYLEATGSLRDACGLLNSMRRRHPGWRNHSDRLLQLNRLGHCYRLLKRYESATWCFERERAESEGSAWSEEVGERTQLGRAALIVDQYWSQFIDQICRSDAVEHEQAANDLQSDQLRLAGSLLERRTPGGSELNQSAGTLSILCKARLAVLQKNIHRVQEVVCLFPESYGRCGVSADAVELSHVYAIVQLMLGRPDKALTSLLFPTQESGDVNGAARLVSHRLSAKAAEQLLLFQKALEHALEAQRLMQRIALANMHVLGPPAFLEWQQSTALDRGTPAGHGGLIERAIQLIDSHIDDRLSHSFLSAALGTNTRTLQNLFIRQLNVTPMQFIKRRRIERARDLLLLNSGISVRSIAESVGIPRIGTFITGYRAVYGETPSDTVRKRTLNKVASPRTRERNQFK